MNLSARRRAGGSVHAMKKIAGGTTCLRVCWLKERSHMTHNHPTSAEGLTPAYLNGLLAETLPEARVETVNVIDAKTYGEQMVSTAGRRSEEHTSELQSLMRISYAVFCLKNKTKISI